MKLALQTRIQILFVVACFFAVAGASTVANRATLTGKVVDSNGKPLGHATVLVYHAGVKTGYSTYCPSCYVDCGKRALTDAAGAFSIKNLSPDLLFELLVVRDGYFSTFVKSVDPSKGPAPAAVLNTRQPVNDPERVVRGRVVDAHGLPLRDAVVQPQGILINDEKRGHISIYGTVDGLDLIAVTNDKGEFEVSYDRPALKVLLLVEARGLAPKLFNQLPTGLERQTLTMTDGATVRGRLVDNGKPVAGAQIGLVPRQRGVGAELEFYGSPYAEIRIGTQPNGTFLIPNVPVPVDWYIYGTMESIAARGGTVPVECATKTDNEDVNVGDIHVTPPAAACEGKWSSAMANPSRTACGYSSVPTAPRLAKQHCSDRTGASSLLAWCPANITLRRLSGVIALRNGIIGASKIAPGRCRLTAILPISSLFLTQLSDNARATELPLTYSMHPGGGQTSGRLHLAKWARRLLAKSC